MRASIRLFVGMGFLLTIGAGCAENPVQAPPPAAADASPLGPNAPLFATSITTICPLTLMPDDHVVLRYTPNSCEIARQRVAGMVIGIPGRVERVCSGLPNGYVVVEVDAMGTCWTGGPGFGPARYTIKLPGESEWVCMLSQVPGNVQVLGSDFRASCGGPGFARSNATLVRWIRTNRATTPIGQLEEITAGGVVSGWVCQPDHPGLNTEIHLYANAPFPGGKPFAAFRSNRSAEPAVEKQCNGRGTFRFRHTLTPRQLATLGRRGTFMVYAHAIDFDGGPHPVLPSARKLVIR